MPLTESDAHHWAPIAEVMDWLRERIKPEDKVLDVGPGHAPLFRANVFVDFVDPSGFRNAPLPEDFRDKRFVKCDFASEPLPFADKSFDFVFCRHTIEDMYDPFPLLKEMSRVGKSGYIETPSPLAEITRGIDGSAPPYRGYNHHRYVVWSDGQTLRFVSKYPIIEYVDIDDELYAALLRQGPRYWNTYHLWQDEVSFKHVQNPLDFHMPHEYRAVLSKAAAQSVQSTDAFWRNMEQ